MVFRNHHSSIAILSTVRLLEAFVKRLGILDSVVQRNGLGSFRDSTTILEDIVSLTS